MWEFIIFLLVVGLVLVIVEAFMPSGLFAVAGALALALAVGMTYANYGLKTGTWMLGGVIFASFIGTIIWIKFFPKTPTGRRMMLDAVSGGGAPEADYLSLIGKRGVARSNLRPAGIAEIGAHRCDVITEGGMISQGSEVEVVAVDGTKIVVRKV